MLLEMLVVAGIAFRSSVAVIIAVLESGFSMFIN